MFGMDLPGISEYTHIGLGGDDGRFCVYAIIQFFINKTKDASLDSKLH